MGLCCRAGKLVSGSFLCENAIRSGKACLVIVSSEASKGTMDQFSKLCLNYNTEMITAGSKADLGGAIGKGSRTVAAVTDRVFGDMLVKAMMENNPVRGWSVNGENKGV